MEILLCVAVGAAGHERWLEAVDMTILEKCQSPIKPICPELGGKIL